MQIGSKALPLTNPQACTICNNKPLNAMNINILPSRTHYIRLARVATLALLISKHASEYSLLKTIQVNAYRTFGRWITGTARRSRSLIHNECHINVCNKFSGVVSAVSRRLSERSLHNCGARNQTNCQSQTSIPVPKTAVQVDEAVPTHALWKPER